MPRLDKERVEPLQSLEEPKRAPGERVVAHPTDTFEAPFQGETAALLDGLSVFNKGLSAYTAEKTYTERKDAHEQGLTAGRLELNPSANLENPVTMPEHINPAYRASFEEGYKESIGITVGNQSRDALLREYTQHRNEQDFDLEGFLKKWTAQEVAGITDPTILKQVSKVHAQSVLDVRNDFRQTQLKQLQTAAVDTQLKGLASSMEGHNWMEMAQVYHNVWLPPVLKAGNMVRSEANNAFLDYLQAESMKQGGKPELFDALGVPDSSGNSPYDSSPAFREKVEKAKIEARRMRDSSMSDEVLRTNATDRMRLEDHLTAGRFDELTDDKLMQYVGKHSLFSSDNELQSFRARRDKAREAKASIDLAMKDAGRGALWAHDEKDQKAVLSQLTKPHVEAIVSSVNDSRPEAADRARAAMRSVIGITGQTGVQQAEPKLKEFFGSIGSAIPAKDSVAPQRFLRAVDAYGTLKSDAPNLLGLYFDDDSRTVLDAYTKARNAGDEPNLAYQRAYAGVTPEAKERARQLEKDPTFIASVKKATSGITTETWRNWMPFGKAFGLYPTNEDAVHSWATLEVERLLRSNPNMGKDDAMKRVGEEVAANWVHDTKSNLVVRVPAGQASPQAREAIGAFVQEAKQTNKADSVQLDFDGKDGYTIRTVNPDRVLAGKVSFQDILQKNYAGNHLTAAEGTSMVELRKNLVAGSATVADLERNSELIAKAKRVGAWDSLAAQKADRLRRQNAPAATTHVMGLFGDQRPSNDNLDVSRIPANATKTQVAQEFLRQGDQSGALTAMGEGVALRSYRDPAGKATIGIGYNMEANAATLKDDFRRAGIPADKIEDVRTGKAEITAEQAMRLYQAVQPRYAKVAQEAIDKRYPGEWAKLPANQRAVLTDMAYQVGSIDKFGTTLNALVSGDLELAGSGMKVHYKSRKTGEMVADLGRHNLRLYMLNSPSQFENVVVKPLANRPRSLIEARAAN